MPLLQREIHIYLHSQLGVTKLDDNDSNLGSLVSALAMRNKGSVIWFAVDERDDFRGTDLFVSFCEQSHLSATPRIFAIPPWGFLIYVAVPSSSQATSQMQTLELIPQGHISKSRSTRVC